MRKVFFGVILLLSCLIWACGDVYQHKMPLEKARQYFPMEVGAHWLYEIKVNEKERPYDFHLRYNPVSDGIYISRVGGNYLSTVVKEKGRPYRLAFHIARAVTEDLPYDLTRMVEVIIDEDELGIYQGHNKVYWGYDTEGELVICQIVTYKVRGQAEEYTFTMQGLPVPEEAFAKRILFFNGMVGEGYSLPPADFGITDYAEKYFLDGCLAGEKTLVFKREIDNNMPQFGAFPKKVQEKMWFAPGKGLFLLEQKCGRKTTMDWRLKTFTRGET